MAGTADGAESGVNPTPQNSRSVDWLMPVPKLLANFARIIKNYIRIIKIKEL